MIKFSLICRSNYWPARFNKVNSVVKKILILKKDLYFNNKINYNCNIILSDNRLIKKMNNKFRSKKDSTNVLTFVSDSNFDKGKKTRFCDIFLAAETIKKEANISKVTFYDHLTHLLIHSFLHINGFTHHKIKDYDKMKNKEVKILNKLGINNPYLYY